MKKGFQCYNLQHFWYLFKWRRSESSNLEGIPPIKPSRATLKTLSAAYNIFVDFSSKILCDVDYSLQHKEHPTYAISQKRKKKSTFNYTWIFENRVSKLSTHSTTWQFTTIKHHHYHRLNYHSKPFEPTETIDLDPTFLTRTLLS